MSDDEGRCELCKEMFPISEILEHLRLFHPDEYGDGPETWPDGTIVIHDTTLEPDDFG